jgi:hypothetical protein
MGRRIRITDVQWYELCAAYSFRCVCCGEQKDISDLRRDHIISWNRGGSSTLDNCQPLCVPCNALKRDRIIDFRRTPFQGMPSERVLQVLDSGLRMRDIRSIRQRLDAGEHGRFIAQEYRVQGLAIDRIRRLRDIDKYD